LINGWYSFRTPFEALSFEEGMLPQYFHAIG